MSMIAGASTTVIQRLARVAVPLTAAGQTTLYTVPAGRTLYVSDVLLEGVVVPTGAVKTATVKIGTTAGSYAELLNGATGLAFATASATTLLAVGSAVSGQDIALPATVSAAMVRKFVAGTVLKVDVSGASPPTTGDIIVELLGFVE